MSEATGYEPGSFCWADLGTPDRDEAGEFYGELLGWEVTADENAEQIGGYRVATLNGRAVGGVMGLMEESQPPAWLVYVAVADLDEALDRVRRAGGSVYAGPHTVLDYGRMAVIGDPAGAQLGLWQAGSHKGAEARDEYGAVCWNELATRDPEEAARFYSAVLGWEIRPSEAPGAEGYRVIVNRGEEVGGVLDMRGVAPDEVPPSWIVYLAVRDAEAVIARAGELGGSVLNGPMELPVGSFAVLADPGGAAFAVIQPSLDSNWRAEIDRASGA